jgi:hypothetical protein
MKTLTAVSLVLVLIISISLNIGLIISQDHLKSELKEEKLQKFQLVEDEIIFRKHFRTPVRSRFRFETRGDIELEPSTSPH